ncbi:unnamed protein product [Arabidopsis lyrata]|nr:unnamed protein product [Arabidopsis lyrata]
MLWRSKDLTVRNQQLHLLSRNSLQNISFFSCVLEELAPLPPSLTVSSWLQLSNFVANKVLT